MRRLGVVRKRMSDRQEVVNVVRIRVGDFMPMEGIRDRGGVSVGALGTVTPFVGDKCEIAESGVSPRRTGVTECPAQHRRDDRWGVLSVWSA